MYELNAKIKNLTPYEPVEGNYKIRLDANESCFALPQDIIDKIHAQIDKMNFNRYPDPLAKELTQAFSNYYGIDSALVTAGNGSDELISIIMNAFLMKGDKVITLTPDFSMYGFYASLCEAQCIRYEKNKDLTIDADSLIHAVNQIGARMLIFSNPCNPTSKGLCAADVIKLVSGVNALVVLDEAYMDFWEQSILSQAASYDNLIVLRTASKAIGAAAIRLGFAIACPTITNVLRAVKSPYNVNTFTQQAGKVIYESTDYLDAVKDKLISLRTSLGSALKQLEAEYPQKLSVIEGNSNFVFIKTPLALQIYEYLLNKSIAIRYMGDYIRITAGTEAENAELLANLKDFFTTE